MGRPREHDADTAAALLDAAERIVQGEGLDALTVRRVADEVATSTRAVYSLFGSKEGLVVALGQRAFAILGEGLATAPQTDDPANDLIDGVIAGFRPLAIEHPSLFQIALQRPPAPEIKAGFRDNQAEALAGLAARIERLEAAGLLGGRPVWAVLCELDALCEGLASLELRGILRLHPPAGVVHADHGVSDQADDLARVARDREPAGSSIEEQIWRDALTALIRGFALSDAAYGA